MNSLQRLHNLPPPTSATDTHRKRLPSNPHIAHTTYFVNESYVSLYAISSEALVEGAGSIKQQGNLLRNRTESPLYLNGYEAARRYLVASIARLRKLALGMTARGSLREC